MEEALAFHEQSLTGRHRIISHIQTTMTFMSPGRNISIIPGLHRLKHKFLRVFFNRFYRKSIIPRGPSGFSGVFPDGCSQKHRPSGFWAVFPDGRGQRHRPSGFWAVFPDGCSQKHRPSRFSGDFPDGRENIGRWRTRCPRRHRRKGWRRRSSRQLGRRKDGRR